MMDKKSQGEALIAQGKALIQQAFHERQLPEKWRVGHNVRMLIFQGRGRDGKSMAHDGMGPEMRIVHTN